MTLMDLTNNMIFWSVTFGTGYHLNKYQDVNLFIAIFLGLVAGLVVIYAFILLLTFIHFLSDRKK